MKPRRPIPIKPPPESQGEFLLYKAQDGADKISVFSILETTATDGKNYRKQQDAEYISDFDKAVKRLKSEKGKE